MLVLRLCTADSVETKMLQRAQSKLALDRVVIKRGLYEGDLKVCASARWSLLIDLVKVFQSSSTATKANTF